MRVSRIICGAALGWLLTTAVTVQADGNLLAYPVDDAKSAFRTGNYEFVGIELADKVELPGLDDSQVATVQAQYRIRLMNKRWKTFDQIEDKPEELLRLRQYGLRFNLTLWRLLQTKKMEDARRYRY